MKLIALFICLVSLAHANTQWSSNRDHSEILFKLSYLEVSEVTGRFNDFMASAEFDDQRNPTSVKVSIKSDSIDTSQKLRDSHLKREEFFGTKNHPEIIFLGNKVSKIGKDKFKVNGNITIKNITKPMTVYMELTKDMKDTWGHNNRFVKFTSKINRQDFNIKWNKTLDEKKFLVGDEVSLWGVFQLQLSNDSTPASKHMIPDTDYIRGREDKIRQKKNEPKEESNISKKFRKLINGQ